MDVHVISLEDSRRREICRNRLVSKGYNPVFHDAFDSRNLNENQLEDLFDFKLFRKSFNYKIDSGIVGCVLSHYYLYKTLLESKNNSEYYIIVEDDCIPLATSNDLENTIDAALESSFDILLLGYSKTDDAQYKIINKMNPFKKLYSSGKFNIGIRYKQSSCGAVAYVVSRRFLKNITTSIKKPYYVADEWSFLEKRLELLILHTSPLCFLEDYNNMVSNLENGRITNRSVKIRLPYFIRPLWRNVYGFYARVMLHIKLIINNKL
jgi:glycosyl transferase, family 25|tara:strand:+ start:6569 stop:7363 length:795 start_codon:yes stop_codon:yes gene_type:complete